MKISVCIPTFNRLEHLKQAIDSCLNQTFKPFEIIISDDSSDDDTEIMLKQLKADNQNITIRYKRNQPSLRQVKNVNQLFEMAKGDYIVLLHDDDTLHNEALAVFKSCFEKDVTIDIVYGKQYIMDNDGLVNYQASKQLNKGYYRSAHYAIHQLKPIEAGLVQQFPNDAYMLKSQIAKENKYSESAKDACDFEFGLRLGINNYKMHFVNVYTAYYRISNEAISSSNNDFALMAYLIAKKTPVPESSMALKNKWMVTQSKVACHFAIKLRSKKEAWDIYFDPWHRKNIWTLGGVKRFFQLVIK